MITTVMFDLDGTLLPFVQEEFIKLYFGSLGNLAAGYGYDKQKFVKDLYKGCDAMVRNDGSRPNHDAFWDTFKDLNKGLPDIEPMCDEYYTSDFNKVKACFAYEADRKLLIERLKNAGLEVVLATTPMFPECAVKTRLGWVNLSESDFKLITNYNNSTYCKPNPEYYSDILGKIGRNPEECFMIGNNIPEDILPTKSLGIENFLVSEFAENPKGEDISKYRSGTLEQAVEYVLSIK